MGWRFFLYTDVSGFRCSAYIRHFVCSSVIQVFVFLAHSWLNKFFRLKINNIIYCPIPLLTQRQFGSVPRAGPLNLDALEKSKEWCLYKKNPQKL